MGKTRADSSDNAGGRETWARIASGSRARAEKEGRLTWSHVLDERVAVALDAAAKGEQEALEAALRWVIEAAIEWAIDIGDEEITAYMKWGG